MGLPEMLCIIGLIVSASVFYWHARLVSQRKLGLDGFMLANKELNKNQFGHTFSASSYSLGMMVPFLLINSKIFGIFILVSPLTFVAGYIFFTWVIKNSNIDLDDCRTLSDIIYKIYPNKTIAKLITCITITSYVMLLFIEIYTGTCILTVFLGEHLGFQTIAFFLIGIVSLLYVLLGGMVSLVITDKYQLLMAMFAVFSIFVFGLLAPSLSPIAMSNIMTGITNYTADTVSMAWFLIWLAFINFVAPFTQLVCYQRLSATSSKDASWKGIIKGSRKLLLMLLLTVFGFMLLHLKGYEIKGLNDFFLLVKNGDLFSRIVLFPILITGGLSMIFSSTDIAIIAIFYALSDSNTFKEKFNNLDDVQLRKTLKIFTIIILAVLTVIYWLQYAGMQSWLMPLIYTTCSQLAILAGIPIYFIYKLKREGRFIPIKATRKNSLILFGSISFSWALLFVGGYFSKITGSAYHSLISMPIGTIIIFCSVIWTDFYSKTGNLYGGATRFINVDSSKNASTVEEKVIS